MKVLVTGSSGRVGRAICVHLRLRHDVVGLDRVASPAAVHVGDVADPALVRSALRGVDAVIHVAALHAPHVGRVSGDRFESVNVEATRSLARLAVDAGVRRFVFTSTTALYGDAATPPDAAGWVDESLEPRPRTIYHRTKLAAEELLEKVSRESGLAVTVLRMSRCFPEPAPLMTVYRLHRGVDARDVADAHARALERPLPGFQRFLISFPTPFERGDTAELLRDAPAVIRRRAPAVVEAFGRRGWTLPSSIDRVYVPARAMNELDWRPRHGWVSVLHMPDEESAEALPPPQAQTGRRAW